MRAADSSPSRAAATTFVLNTGLPSARRRASAESGCTRPATPAIRSRACPAATNSSDPGWGNPIGAGTAPAMSRPSIVCAELAGGTGRAPVDAAIEHKSAAHGRTDGEQHQMPGRQLQRVVVGLGSAATLVSLSTNTGTPSRSSSSRRRGTSASGSSTAPFEDGTAARDVETTRPVSNSTIRGTLTPTAARSSGRLLSANATSWSTSIAASERSVGSTSDSSSVASSSSATATRAGCRWIPMTGLLMRDLGASSRRADATRTNAPG